MNIYYEHAGIRIFHGDCREVFSGMVDVDVTLTDPPYSEHVHKSNRKGLTAHAGVFSERRELGFECLDPEVRLAVSLWVAAHTTRWIGVFSDTESSHLWSHDLVAAGSEYIRTAFWHKVGGAPQFTGDRPAVACEAITLCHQKGRKQWNGGGRQGIYSVPIVVKRGGPNEIRVHTTQKPIDLMLQLVADFSNEGETIFDPFMGSGTTLVAAKQIGRKAIGIELNEAYCEIAAQRLQQEAFVFAEKDV